MGWSPLATDGVAGRPVGGGTGADAGAGGSIDGAVSRLLSSGIFCGVPSTSWVAGLSSFPALDLFAFGVPKLEANVFQPVILLLLYSEIPIMMCLVSCRVNQPSHLPSTRCGVILPEISVGESSFPVLCACESDCPCLWMPLWTRTDMLHSITKTQALSAALSS